MHGELFISPSSGKITNMTYQRNFIGDLAERINMADGINDPIRRIDFLMGTKYETGSDYDYKTLHSRLGDLMGMTMCGACDGLGWQIYNTSEDGDKDVCHECWGSGYEGYDHDVEAEINFRRAL